MFGYHSNALALRSLQRLSRLNGIRNRKEDGAGGKRKSEEVQKEIKIKKRNKQSKNRKERIDNKRRA